MSEKEKKIKQCKKCKFKSPLLDWDRKYYAESGKWRLAMVKTNVDGVTTYTPHECDNGQKFELLTSDKVKHCGLCYGNYGYTHLQAKLEEHMKIYHPNKEVRYEDSFKVGKIPDKYRVSRICSICNTLHTYYYGNVKNRKSVTCEDVNVLNNVSS